MHLQCELVIEFTDQNKFKSAYIEKKKRSKGTTEASCLCTDTHPAPCHLWWNNAAIYFFNQRLVKRHTQLVKHVREWLLCQLNPQWWSRLIYYCHAFLQNPHKPSSTSIGVVVLAGAIFQEVQWMIFPSRWWIVFPARSVFHVHSDS